jgi:hypothetical protein
MKRLASEPTNGNMELAGILSTYLGEGENGMTANKVQAGGEALYRYFSKQKAILGNIGENEISPSKASHSTPDRPAHRPPDMNWKDLGAYDYDKFLRSLAELAVYGKSGQGNIGKVGDGNKWTGWARKALLDLTLRGLQIGRYWAERGLGLNRDRLPGESGGFTGAGAKVLGGAKAGLNSLKSLQSGNVLGAIGGVADLFGDSTPKRRPDKDGTAGGNIDEIYSQSYLGKETKLDTYAGALQGQLPLNRGTNLYQDVDSLSETIGKDKRTDIYGNDFTSQTIGSAVINNDKFGYGLTLKDLCPESSECFAFTAYDKSPGYSDGTR